MAVIYTNNISEPDYRALRASAGWFPIPSAQAEAGLRGSALIVAAEDGGRAVGCARLVWDGGYAALLKDVLVLPEYQGHGIGAEMVTRIIEFLKSRLRPGYVMQVDLMAASGKEGFYEKLGFSPRPRENRGAGMDMLLRN